MQAKVSIAIPVYNKAAYIADHLASLAAQRWQRIELVFVNDGATDGSRQILEQWLPRLRGQGFEVQVIDQPNQGICAAVYRGLAALRGDYICCVDCDDILHPDYVLDMAAALEADVCCQWVCCEHQYNTANGIQPRYDTPASLADDNFLENYLLRRIPVESWIYMVRAAYFKQCRVLEHFCRQPRACQEPDFVIPLAAGGGKLGCLPQVRYTHVLQGRKDTVTEQQQLNPEFWQNHGTHVEMAINNLDVSPKRKAFLLDLHTVCHVKTSLALYPDKTVEYSKDVLEIWRRAYQTEPRWQELETSQVICLLAALEDTLLGRQPKTKWPGRVFGCGVLGAKAGRLLHLLQGSPLMPDVLWDSGAQCGASRSGMLVTLPDFSMVQDGDNVLVFPVAQGVYGWVTQQLAGKQVQLYRYHDICGWAGSYWSGQLSRGAQWRTALQHEGYGGNT